MASSAVVCAPRVVLRLRPAASNTSNTTQQRCTEIVSSESVQFRGDLLPSPGDVSTFAFDHVLGDGCSQSDLFAACRPIIDAFLDSYNGTIMAYGQTGSGKTHSLFGTEQQPGVVPHVIRTLVDEVLTKGAASTLHLHAVEIYCERIRDLLHPSQRDNLNVTTDRDGCIVVADATQVEVRDAAQALRVIDSALKRRAVSSTNMNQRSSRSHCMVTITLSKSGGQRSKLCLVDLAGSERQDKTGAEGTTLDEAKLINKSLSCLGNVVMALTTQQAHVPYRNSKLTRVLADSLGGNARTMILICASQAVESAVETLSSLRFGARARGVKNVVVQGRPSVAFCSGARNSGSVEAREEDEKEGTKTAVGYHALLCRGAAACAVQLAAMAVYFWWVDTHVLVSS